MNKKRKNMFI